jgi:FKBP-type peptidyl-prolyl cis-trans isomerase FkpA
MKFGLIALSLCAAMTIKSTEGAMAAEPGKPDKDAPKEFTKTDSGLKYRVLRKSDGTKPGPTSTVTVHYRGWLPDKTGDGGKEFDSSYKRDEPTTFPLNGVIKGWTEGLQLVGTGGMIELEIPPDLAYGEQGAGDVIPPNATLRFLVEWIEIK